jgi:hypothetical protein
VGWSWRHSSRLADLLKLDAVRDRQHHGQLGGGIEFGRGDDEYGPYAALPRNSRPSGIIDPRKSKLLLLKVFVSKRILSLLPDIKIYGQLF